MNFEIYPTIVTAIGAVFVAVITGILTVLAGRPKAKADIQTAINSGFSTLIDKLNSTIAIQDTRIQALEAENVGLQKQVSHLVTVIRKYGIDY